MIGGVYERYWEKAVKDKVSVTEGRGIQSVEVAFEILLALSGERAKVPLKTLALKAGMPPSKVHIYLTSFRRLGIVVQDPATLRYGLGAGAIRLGLAAIHQLDVADASRAPMEALQAQTGLSVTLSIWGNLGPTIIAKLDSPLPVPLMVRVGFVLPILSSATGRAFLAHLPQTSWLDMVTREGVTPKAAVEQGSVIRQTVLRHGVATSDSQLNAGFAAIACPVFEHGGRVCAAITLLGLSDRMDLQPSGEMARAVKQAGQDLSRQLGAQEGETGQFGVQTGSAHDAGAQDTAG